MRGSPDSGSSAKHWSKRVSNVRIPVHAALRSQLNADLGDAISLAQLAKRPGVSARTWCKYFCPDMKTSMTDSDLDSALADSLYAGYLQPTS